MKNKTIIFYLLFIMFIAIFIYCDNDKGTDDNIENNNRINENETNNDDIDSNKIKEEIVKDNIKEEMNVEEDIIDIKNESEKEGITYEEAIDNVTDENKDVSLSSEGDDLTVILAYGIVASSIVSILKDNNQKSVTCMIAKQSVNEVNSTYNTELEDIINYCKGNNTYSDKKECELIINMYNECY